MLGEGVRNIDGCDVEKFGALGGSEKTIVILGDRWRPPTAKEELHQVSETFFVLHGRNATSAQMLEVSLLGVGTVLRLEGDAWSMVK